MAEKERIQDEAVESVSGGKLDIQAVGKALGVDTVKLKNELENTVERISGLVINAAMNVQSGDVNGIVASSLEGKSSEDDPGNASAIASH